MAKRKAKIPKHQHAAALASARVALKSLCWVTIQTPDHGCEVTAYVNFRTMQVLPWGAQAALIRQVMNAQAYNWQVWWVLKLDNWDGADYRITPLAESQNNRRKLKDLLQEVAHQGQELTEEQRLDKVIGRGAILTTSDLEISNERLMHIYMLVAEQGTPVDQIKQIANEGI